MLCFEAKDRFGQLGKALFTARHIHVRRRDPIDHTRMAVRTEAQEEFDSLVNAQTRGPQVHPEDRKDNEHEEPDEETKYHDNHINEIIKIPTMDRGRVSKVQYKLPHQSFDYGRATGVKGVIADARSYEQAKREGASDGRHRSASSTRQFPGQINGATAEKKSVHESYSSNDSEKDEDFLEQWREARRKELMREGNDIRNRRTSPSVRSYGRFDTVDALGYLDAIEKVGRDTVVVVFVYDIKVCVLPRTMERHKVQC